MIVIFLFVVALSLDQVTKIIVRQSMEIGQSIPVIGDFLRFTYVENPGIAFGIQIGHSGIFTVLSLLASCGIIIYLITHWHEPMGIKGSLALILGGAFGNLIDRILFGQVADFIEVGIGRYRWPVFNIADSSVVIGMFILFITVFKMDRKKAMEQTNQETD